MFFGARTPEFACRHPGAPWGRRDIHLPPYWTRAVQAYLPSDDHIAASSLFRQCRLKLAPGDRMKSWRFPPHPPQDITTMKRLEVPSGARAWARPTTGSFPGVITCQLAEIFAFTFTSIVFVSWQKSIAMQKPPLPLPKTALKTKEHRALRHIFNCKNPKEPQHQILRS